MMWLHNLALCPWKPMRWTVDTKLLILVMQCMLLIPSNDHEKSWKKILNSCVLILRTDISQTLGNCSPTVHLVSRQPQSRVKSTFSGQGFCRYWSPRAITTDTQNNIPIKTPRSTRLRIAIQWIAAEQDCFLPKGRYRYPSSVIFLWSKIRIEKCFCASIDKTHLCIGSLFIVIIISTVFAGSMWFICQYSLRWLHWLWDNSMISQMAVK